TASYQLPAVAIGADQVRLWATVRYPATSAGDGAPVADGRLPIALFLHGNHGIFRAPDGEDVCEDIRASTPGTVETPNHEGYDYILDNLAKGGTIAVSINANDLNCKN